MALRVQNTIESLARVCFYFHRDISCCNQEQTERKKNRCAHLSFSWLACNTSHGVLLWLADRLRSLGSKHAWRTRSQSRKLLLFAPVAHLHVESPCPVPILEFGFIKLGRHSSTAQSWCQISNGTPVNEPSRCGASRDLAPYVWNVSDLVK